MENRQFKIEVLVNTMGFEKGTTFWAEAEYINGMWWVKPEGLDEEFLFNEEEIEFIKED